jgi:hypothetical protein
MRSKGKGGRNNSKINYLLQIKIQILEWLSHFRQCEFRMGKKEMQAPPQKRVLNCQPLTAEVPNDQSPAESTRR